ncbi:MAG: DUF1905 domain-containing protein [Myxococcaceae bacterium]
MAPTHRLTTTLVREGHHTFVYVPSTLVQTREKIRVRGTLNGHTFATSASPFREEEHLITLNPGMRDRMGLVGGEKVELTFTLEEPPSPLLRLPPDVREAIESTAGAVDAFAKMSQAHRLQYVALIELQKDEPRSQRIASAVSMILAGRDPFELRRSQRP